MKIVWLVVFAIVYVGEGHMSVSPQNKTVHPYTQVNFTCEGYGVWVVWYINSGRWDKELLANNGITILNEVRGQDITTNIDLSSTLVLDSAVPKLNRPKRFSCYIVEYFPNRDGKDGYCYDYYCVVEVHVMLYLKGFKPVKDIQTNLTGTSNWLIWSPPSIPQEYLSKLVLIYKINVHIIKQNLLDLHFENVTTNVTSLQLPTLELCDVVMASISVTSGGYTSTNVNITSQYDFTSYYRLNNSHYVSYAHDENYFILTVLMTVETNSEKMCNYILESIIEVNETISNHTITESNLTSVLSTSKTYMYNVVGIPSQLKGNLTTYLYNYFSVNLIASNSTSFSTYHVQGINVVNNEGLVRVECVFAFSSTADGCQVKFTHKEQGIDGHITIARTAHKVHKFVKLTVGGHFRIAAYDIVNGSAHNIPSVVYPDIFEYKSDYFTVDATKYEIVHEVDAPKIYKFN